MDGTIDSLLDKCDKSLCFNQFSPLAECDESSWNAFSPSVEVAIVFGTIKSALLLNVLRLDRTMESLVRCLCPKVAIH
jgi:hypothetical protein